MNSDQRRKDNFAKGYYSDKDRRGRERARDQESHRREIDSLRTQLDDDSPGTPRGRLKGICDYAVNHCGHSPLSSRGGDVVVMEECSRLKEEGIAQRTEMLRQTEQLAAANEREKVALQAVRDGWTREEAYEAERDRLREALKMIELGNAHDPRWYISLAAEAIHADSARDAAGGGHVAEQLKSMPPCKQQHLAKYAKPFAHTTRDAANENEADDAD